MNSSPSTSPSFVLKDMIVRKIKCRFVSNKSRMFLKNLTQTDFLIGLLIGKFVYISQFFTITTLKIDFITNSSHSQNLLKFYYKFNSLIKHIKDKLTNESTFKQSENVKMITYSFNQFIYFDHFILSIDRLGVFPTMLKIIITIMAIIMITIKHIINLSV